MFRSPQLRCDLSVLPVNVVEDQNTQYMEILENFISYNAFYTIIHALFVID